MVPFQNTRRILFASRSFLLDDSNGASVASRAMLGALRRRGFSVEALCGTQLDAGDDRDLADFLADRRLRARAIPPSGGGASGCIADLDGIPLAIAGGRLRARAEPDEAEVRAFLGLFGEALGRSRPDVLVTYGGDPLTRMMLARAREVGVVTVFALHNFAYRDPSPFADADAVIVPSRFAAGYYRRAIGLDCAVLPNLVDFGRVVAEHREPRYLTFVNPSPEKGVYFFARIADVLGRRRPDIPILVVESRGSEAGLVDCGLDLREHGNVFLMSQTPDPRDFWRVTRACLVPSLWWENQPLVVLEALSNGIPVIGSDRGGIPEALGGAGLALPIPDRLTPATRSLATEEEVTPWVEAIVRLWDDADWFAEQERRAAIESRRWSRDSLEGEYARFFDGVRRRPRAPVAPLAPEDRVVVFVPHWGEIGWECEQALRRLEDAGARVVRREVRTDLAAALDELLSEALHDGDEEIVLVDPDAAFDHLDVLRLVARPEPAIAGIGGAWGDGRRVAFDPSVSEVRAGPGAPGLYPLLYADAPILRLRSGALRRMIAGSGLPLCDADRGRGLWPFFQPMIIPLSGGEGHRLLRSMEAFFHRIHRAGITPLADTSGRLSPGGRSSPWARAATAWDEVPGMFDFPALYDAAVDAAPDGAIFVEIGCLAGRSTCYLATKIRESGKAIALYAVDTGRGSPNDSTGRVIAPSQGGTLAGVLHRNLIGCGVDDIVVPIFTTSLKAASLFLPEALDFCFIDADHSYESVMADLRAWWPKVKPGGTLAGHDYRGSAPWLVGVTPAVHEFFSVEDASHSLCPTCWSVEKPRG